MLYSGAMASRITCVTWDIVHTVCVPCPCYKTSPESTGSTNLLITKSRFNKLAVVLLFSNLSRKTRWTKHSSLPHSCTQENSAQKSEAPAKEHTRSTRATLWNESVYFFGRFFLSFLEELFYPLPTTHFETRVSSAGCTIP